MSWRHKFRIHTLLSGEIKLIFKALWLQQLRCFKVKAKRSVTFQWLNSDGVIFCIVKILTNSDKTVCC